MIKSVEDAVKDYNDKMLRLAAWPTTSEVFIAGDANGYARAIDEASEGYNSFVESMEIESLNEAEAGFRLWVAAKLSSQKELEEKNKRIRILEVSLSLESGESEELVFWGKACAKLITQLKEKDAQILELGKEVENYEINISKVMKERDSLEGHKVILNAQIDALEECIRNQGVNLTHYIKRKLRLEEKLKVAEECLTQAKSVLDSSLIISPNKDTHMSIVRALIKIRGKQKDTDKC